MRSPEHLSELRRRKKYFSPNTSGIKRSTIFFLDKARIFVFKVIFFGAFKIIDVFFFHTTVSS